MIQEPYTYDDQYFENIREFKKSKHTMSYVYYAAWAPLEGLTGYKDPASWGERIVGLPDSLDICNLWMGYPSPDPKSSSYAPVAYADMKYAQEKLGTRFVLHGDASTTRDVIYKGDTLNILDLYTAWKSGGEEAPFRQALKNHADLMIDKINEAGLDGVDVDWEPGNNVWRDKTILVDLMKYLRETLPADKLVILDLFSDVPPAEVNEYIDYQVIQCYTPQIGCSAAQVKNFYTTRGINAGIPAKKIIACEQGGQTDYALNGGGEWKETSSGATLTTSDGSKMYSYEGFARHTSENGLAGWGVFYVDRNYYSAKGPYYEFRRAIQIANPSIR